MSDGGTVSLSLLVMDATSSVTIMVEIVVGTVEVVVVVVTMGSVEIVSVGTVSFSLGIRLLLTVGLNTVAVGLSVRLLTVASISVDAMTVEVVATGSVTIMVEITVGSVTNALVIVTEVEGLVIIVAEAVFASEAVAVSSRGVIELGVLQESLKTVTVLSSEVSGENIRSLGMVNNVTIFVRSLLLDVDIFVVDSWEASEPLLDVDEGVLLVHLVGHGRLRMREGDVMATIIVTLEASGLLVLGELVGWVLVLRLPDLTVVLGKVQTDNAGHEGEDFFVSFTSAVGSDSEEVLNHRVDNGEMSMNQRLLVATEIVISEQLDLLSFSHEHRVNEEDRGRENLSAVVDGLHDVASLEEGSHVRLESKDGVLDGCLSQTDGLGDMVRSNLLFNKDWSGVRVSLTRGCGEIGLGALEIAIASFIGVLTSSEGDVASKGWLTELHKGGE